MTTVDPVPPVIPIQVFGSSFSRSVTLLLGVLVVLIFTVVLVPESPDERLRALERPADTAVRVFERDLEVNDALAAQPAWLRRLGAIALDASPDRLSAAIDAYRDVLALARRDEHAQSDELRARLAILLEESGRSDDAREELTRLDERGRTDVADTIRAAYAEPPPASTRDIGALVLDLLGPGWAKDRLLARIAARSGDAALQSRLDAEAVQQNEHWRTRIAWLIVAYVTPCAIGLALIVAWLWKRRPPLPAASAHVPPAWNLDDGVAVLVRAAFAGLVIGGLVAMAYGASDSNPLLAWPTLFASLPMVWWIRRALTKPYGLDLRTTFGLWTRPAQSTRGHATWSWAAFVIALMSLDLLGTAAISAACRSFGLEYDWAEAVRESFIWSPGGEVLVDAVDGTLWAPIFEEIGCRGLLFFTLRTRIGAQAAALGSGALFGIVHGYSLSGFLTVTWSGYLFAIAVERCRSLVPGMICHAFWNGMWFVSCSVLYR